jgi:GDP-4-dehydro-6-deoxy-D-mannose reductase
VGASWKSPADTINVNVNGTLNLLEAIRKHAPQAKTLLIGSAEEYAIPDGRSPLKETDPLEASNPYGISKIAQENFAQLYRKKYGMKIVCTRSFNHTGVGQTTTFALPSFVKQVAAIDKSGKPGKILVGNLSAWRDFSDVEDVVHVYRMLLENENEFDIYNVGSGIANKIEDLLKNVILKLTPVQIDIVVDPEKVRPVETPYLCADNSRVKKYWKGTDIRTTLKKMFDHFRAESGTSQE